MTGTAAINRESAPRAAKRRRTESTKEESETKRGSTIEVVEQIAKEVVNRTGPRGMPHDRAEMEEEAWDEYRQAREMIDRMGDVCLKAVHLLAVIDLSSSNVENWKRAKRILRIIADASANNDSCRRSAVDDIGSSRVALPCLRCHFPRFTVTDDDGPDCGLHITHYLLGVAYYLQGKLNKAVKALEGATRGDFYEAHYLLGTQLCSAFGGYLSGERKLTLAFCSVCAPSTRQLCGYSEVTRADHSVRRQLARARLFELGCCCPRHAGACASLQHHGHLV
jgi:hypothetical protein